jgi:aspartate-semialdehyde dehydrogenase
MNKFKIGIVGVRGLVGKTLLRILCENGYGSNIKVCATDANIGIDIIIDNYVFTLIKLDIDFFNNLDIIFFCADTKTSLKWIPKINKKKVLIIDNSSAFRSNDNVPLIIPEINGNIILDSYGVVSNPNCCATLLCMVLYPLLQLSNIKRVDVSTYQSVSGAGIGGINELENQTIEVVKNEPITKKIFKSQIYGNCFSHNTEIDINTGYCEEELKICNETKKILSNNLEISATCIRIGVFTSHSESVKIVFENSVDEYDLRNALNNFKGVVIVDDRINNIFPEPINTSGKTDVFVGRIRKDLYDKSGKTYNLFLCGDQLLKGASYNSYQIFKKYEELSNN